MKSVFHNPFVGPRSLVYGELLHGRERSCHHLRNLIVSQRVVLLYAPSGAGKTSLLHAGLLPLLEQERFYVPDVLRLNHEPPAQLTLSSQFNPFSLSLMMALQASLPPDQHLPPERLMHMGLRAYFDLRFANLGADTFPLLIIDQLEEIIHAHLHKERERKNFFRELGLALKDERLFLLCALREDYLAALDPYKASLPDHIRAQYRLPPMNRHVARQTITATAKQAGMSFHKDALDHLVSQLSVIHVNRADGSDYTLHTDVVEPMHLQVTCRQLCQQLRADTKIIDLELVTGQGNVGHALSTYFDNTVVSVSERFLVGENRLRAWIETELINPQGFRCQVLVGDQQSQGLANEVIEGLLEAHILRKEQKRGAIWVELAHDRLLKVVQDCNASWRENHWHTFQKHARIWEAQNKPRSLLLRGTNLREAQAWAKAHREELNEIDKAFLAEGEKEKRAKQWRLTRFIIFCLLMVSAIGFTAYSRHKTLQARQKARQQQQAAQAEAAFLSDIFIESDPYTAGKITARELLKKGTDLLENRLKEHPELRPRLLLVAAQAHGKLGLYGQGLELLAQAQKAIQNVNHDPYTELRIMALTAVLAGESGSLEYALLQAEEAYRLTHTRLDNSEHVHTGAAFALARVYLLLERRADALPKAQEALSHWQNHWEGDHQELADRLELIAEILSETSPEQALIYATDAYQMKRRLLGGDHPFVAKTKALIDRLSRVRP